MPDVLGWPAASLFGATWDDLTLDHVRTFLAKQSDDHEGLTWEAKGGTIRAEHIHNALSAFGNSVLGGYLILGAQRARPTDPWQTPGWAFPDEPGVWIAQHASRLIDAPVIDVKSWPTAEGRRLAVVAIPPAAVPPVITPRGVVYQRVTGASPTVTDPAVLRAIFERGEQARSRALELSQKALNQALNEPNLEERGLRSNRSMALSLAATGTPRDVTGRLFRTRFAEAFRAAVRRHPEHPPEFYQLEVRASPAGFVGWLEGPHDRGYILIANVDGSVGVAFREVERGDSLGALIDGQRLERGWALADGLVHELGGYGPAVMTVVAIGTKDATLSTHWVSIGGPSKAELGMVRRALRRGRGEAAFEDEAD